MSDGTETTGKMTWAERQRRSNWVFWVEMGAIAGGFIGIVVAAYAVYQQQGINEEQRTLNEEQRKVNALTFKEIQDASKDGASEALVRNWALLTTPASGNSGKKQALEYLASKGEVLSGIDLSCKTMGGMGLNEYDAEACRRPTYLAGLDLSENTHGDRVILENADLSGAYLENADLSGAVLTLADLSGAVLWDADLSGAELSRANFTDASSVETADFSKAWAWADMPPVNLEIEIDLCIYQGDSSASRPRERPDPCIPPASED